MEKKVKVGIIGCGNISAIYFKNLMSYSPIELVACADLDIGRAQARAEEFGVPRGCSVEELLADEAIEIVVNLTIPQAHADVCVKALEAGKHVYVEKPLAVTMEDGARIMDAAARKGLMVGSAPETFLGGGLQTCRKLVDEGWIGRPVAAVAFMMSRGHEHWHPSPEFYYQIGGGPMFDMGPYYLTALVNLLGPIQRVAGSAQTAFPERTITSEPKRGQVMQVEVPTHVAGTLDFENGVTATMVTSFDIMKGADLPRIEIYGSEGSLKVPDPNSFGGPVLLKRVGDWQEIPLTHGYTDNNRGIGVADMALALREGRAHRAHGAMAYHVLEAMHAFHISSEENRHYFMKSGFERPAPMPTVPFT